MSDPIDLALRRAQRFIKRIKHEPFVAILVGPDRSQVDIFHTIGIDREKIQAIRRVLDELEATLD